MKAVVEKISPIECKAEAVFFGMFDDLKLPKNLEKINSLLESEISELLKRKEFSGEFGEFAEISTLKKLNSKKIFLAGFGKKKKFSSEIFRCIGANSALMAKNSGAKNFAIAFNELIPLEKFSEFFQALAEGAILSQYQFSKYKTLDLNKAKSLNEIIFLTSEKQFNEAKKAVEIGKILSNASFIARDLVNEPASGKTPAVLAKKITEICKENKIKCTVFGKKWLEGKKMNSFLSVSHGSINEPKLAVLEYSPANAKKSIALVGKGITFDSGGLNLKPTGYIETMKEDMAGAATVLATMVAAAKLELPVKIFGIMPLTENLPSNNPTKPGDIVKAFNGTTIEILNTDAEGRLVLADALAYAETLKPNMIIDLATLTGAVNVALGRFFIGAMGNNENAIKQLIDSGNKTFERAWQLPLNDEYKELVKSDIADLRNIGKVRGGEAGTIIGGAFLSYFIKDTPWIHLDIASVAFLEDSESFRPYLAKGGTGIGTRLLIDFLEKWKKN